MPLLKVGVRFEDYTRNTAIPLTHAQHAIYTPEYLRLLHPHRSCSSRHETCHHPPRLNQARRGPGNLKGSRQASTPSSHRQPPFVSQALLLLVFHRTPRYLPRLSALLLHLRHHLPCRATRQDGHSRQVQSPQYQTRPTAELPRPNSERSLCRGNKTHPYQGYSLPLRPCRLNEN